MGPVLIKEKEIVREQVTPVKPLKPSMIEHKGICALCVHADYCTFPGSINKSITYCDEWEGYETKPRYSKAKKVIKPYKKEEKYQGLCRYCAQRESCTYPKNDGGVWVCDDYREEN